MWHCGAHWFDMQINILKTSIIKCLHFHSLGNPATMNTDRQPELKLYAWCEKETAAVMLFSTCLRHVARVPEWAYLNAVF